jgi:hypothetical protein
MGFAERERQKDIEEMAEEIDKMPKRPSPHLLAARLAAAREGGKHRTTPTAVDDPAWEVCRFYLDHGITVLRDGMEYTALDYFRACWIIAQTQSLPINSTTIIESIKRQVPARDYQWAIDWDEIFDEIRDYPNAYGWASQRRGR